ncbi:conjugal transfer protein TraQ [Chryseobacterium pennae]|uniref:Conjugal transfer protein TraQ n=1 Tax=Chryseobacterium pennae TaxID=2258962 RepID=A0A3D9C8C7_9FLAO|nr:DUF3872 domain-containing protein [Chryseobacterium pennae]REC61836.1 conjugal transfer protein TraQ [Chryseobacterium pennae]
MKQLLVYYSSMSFGTLLLGIMMIIGTIVLSGCSKDNLDIEENFPFEVKVMPVPKALYLGETAEIRISITADGNYAANQYRIRYFQNDGQGTLGYLGGKQFLPNDFYPIPAKEFRLYYTSESTVSQSVDIWVVDTFGNEKQISLQFNSRKFGPIRDIFEIAD